MRSLAVQLVLQQCYEASCTSVFVVRITVALTGKETRRDLPLTLEKL